MLIPRLFAVALLLIAPPSYALCWFDADCGNQKFCSCQTQVQGPNGRVACGREGGYCASEIDRIPGTRNALQDLAPGSQARADAIEAKRQRIQQKRMMN